MTKLLAVGFIAIAILGMEMCGPKPEADPHEPKTNDLEVEWVLEGTYVFTWPTLGKHKSKMTWRQEGQQFKGHQDGAAAGIDIVVRLKDRRYEGTYTDSFHGTKGTVSFWVNDKGELIGNMNPEGSDNPMGEAFTMWPHGKAPTE